MTADGLAMILASPCQPMAERPGSTGDGRRGAARHRVRIAEFSAVLLCDYHSGAQRCLTQAGMELPFPGPAQPRVAVAAGAPAQADPRHRLEGATAVVRALSQARPHRQAGQHRHHRDRPRTVGLRVGHRPAGDGDDRLIAQDQ